MTGAAALDGAQYEDHATNEKSRAGPHFLLSGLVCGLLLSVFNCLFASLVFNEHSRLVPFLAAGVNMNTISVIVSGLSTLQFSDCGAQTVGPQIYATLAYQQMARNIAQHLGGLQASNGEIAPPTNRECLVCTDDGKCRGSFTCADQILPTTLFVILLSGLLLATLFLALGSLRQTRFVQFVPTSLLGGFMACIGFKAVEAAIKTSAGPWTTSAEHSCNVSDATDGTKSLLIFEANEPLSGQFWIMLLPAIFVGLSLLVCKRKHLLTPSVLVALLFLPAAIFYTSIAISGSSISTARQTGWLFPQAEPVSFWYQWEGFSMNMAYRISNLTELCSSDSSYDDGLSFDKINLSAVTRVLPEIFILLIIQTIHFLLNLSGTKKTLQADINYDEGMLLCGRYNFLQIAFVGTFSCSQLSFTEINYGITGNKRERRPGIIMVLINAALFFSGFPLINYLPRFFLGGMLFFVGLEFLWENMIMGYKHMNHLELANVWFIVLVNAVTETRYAVMCGVALAAVIFANAYSNIGVIKAVIQGTDYQGYVIRADYEDRKLEHLAKGFTIIELHHYIFFGSASSCLDLCKEIIAHDEPLEPIQRRKYLIIDWTAVDGIDVSGVSVFLEMMRLLDKNGIEVVFTGVNSITAYSLAEERVFELPIAVLDTLDLGVEFVEETLLLWAHHVRSRWFEIECLMKFHEQSKLRAKHDAFEVVLSEVGDEVWKYICKRTMESGSVLCSPGDLIDTLYIVQTGKLSAYKQQEDGTNIRVATMKRGAYVNEFSLFMNIPATTLVLADVPTTLLGISRESLQSMEAKSPRVAIEIMRTVMRHYCQNLDKLNREVDGLQREGKGGDCISAGKGGTIVLGVESHPSTGISRSRRMSLTGKLMVEGSQQEERGNEQGNTNVHRHTDTKQLTPFEILLEVWDSDKRESKDSHPTEEDGAQKQLGVDATDTLNSSRFSESGAPIKRMHSYAADGSNERSHQRSSSIKKSRSNDSVSNDSVIFAAGATAVALKEDENNDGVVIRMSHRMESECRACFKYHDSQKAGGKEGHIDPNAVSEALRDMGIFVDDKLIQVRIAASRRRMQSVASLTSRRSNEKNSVRCRNTKVKILLTQDFFIEQGENGGWLEGSDSDENHDLKILLLTQVKSFAELGHSDSNLFRTIASVAKLVQYSKSDYLCVQGEVGDSMLVVFEGTVAVFPTGKPKRLLDSKNEPIMLGERAMFEEMTRGVNVVCHTDTAVALELSRTKLQKAFDPTHPLWDTLRERCKHFETKDAIRKKVTAMHRGATTNKELGFGRRFKMISKVPLFRETIGNNAADITRLANAVMMKHYHDGDSIITQGTRGDSLVVVIEGDVNLVVGGQFIKKLSVFKDPLCFGESVFFMEDCKRTASIVASSEKCVTLELTVSALHSLFDEKHALWAKLRQVHEETVERDRQRIQKGPEESSKKGFIDGLKRSANAEHPPSPLVSSSSKNSSRKGYVNLLEFLDLVQHFRLKDLTEGDIVKCRSIFYSYASENEVMTIVELAALVNNAFGIDVNRKDVLERLVEEWGSVEDQNALTIDDFSSMMAYFLADEENDRNVRELFVNLSEASHSSVSKMTYNKVAKPRQLLNQSRRSAWVYEMTSRGYSITTEGIQQIWRKLKNEDMENDAAEEMIFEADLENKGFLTFENWTETLLSVHDCEIELKQVDKDMLETHQELKAQRAQEQIQQILNKRDDEKTRRSPSWRARAPSATSPNGQSSRRNISAHFRRTSSSTVHFGSMIFGGKGGEGAVNTRSDGNFAGAGMLGTKSLTSVTSKISRNQQRRISNSVGLQMLEDHTRQMQTADVRQRRLSLSSPSSDARSHGGVRGPISATSSLGNYSGSPFAALRRLSRSGKANTKVADETATKSVVVPSNGDSSDSHLRLHEHEH